jgi:hypothetical protein
MYQGRIQDFKLGGAHLKKLRRAEGGANIFEVFRMKNHDFTPKNHIFTTFRGAPGTPPPPWIRPLYICAIIFNVVITYDCMPYMCLAVLYVLSCMFSVTILCLFDRRFKSSIELVLFVLLCIKLLNILNMSYACVISC